MRGCGLALMMSPLLTAALNSVPQHEIPMASSFLNVSQNIGGAMGIAVMNTFVTNAVHVHAIRLGEALPVQSPSFMRLAGAVSDLVVRHSPGLLADTSTKSAFAASMVIQHRAQVLGFDNAFTLAGIVVLAAVPICLLLKPLPHHNGGAREAVSGA
jgi:DHA2 family multidrug resistance protein